MKAKNRNFTFGVVLFSWLLMHSSLAQSQVSPTTTLVQNQSYTTDVSQNAQSNWIGLVSGTIVALIGVGFGLVQFRKSQKLELEKLELQQSREREKLESQQRLEQEKLVWERETLTLEGEMLQLQYDLKLERARQEAELQQQLREAEAEEIAKHQAEAEAVQETTLEDETEIYRDKVLADLRHQNLLKFKRHDLNE